MKNAMETDVSPPIHLNELLTKIFPPNFLDRNVLNRYEFETAD